MKAAYRALFITVLCCLLPTGAQAAGRHLGLRAGANAAAFTGGFGEIMDPQLRITPNVGVVFEQGLNSWLSLHAELGFAGKGGRVDDLPVFGGEVVWRYDYLELPVLLRIRPPASRELVWFFDIGPTAGTPLVGKVDLVSGSIDAKSNMDAFDPGFAVGLGLERVGPSSRLGLDARYTRGFTAAFEGTTSDGMINQSWTVALSWMK